VDKIPDLNLQGVPANVVGGVSAVLRGVRNRDAAGLADDDSGHSADLRGADNFDVRDLPGGEAVGRILLKMI